MNFCRNVSTKQCLQTPFRHYVCAYLSITGAFFITTKKWQQIILRGGLALLALTFCVYAYQYFDLKQWLNPILLANKIESLRTLEANLGLAGPIAFFFIGTVIIVLNVPTVLIIAIAAVIYGPIGAFVLGTLCFCAAISIIYVISKMLGQSFLQGLMQRYMPRTNQYIQNTDLRAIIYLRLIFFALPPINWMLGILSTQFSTYFWGSLIGALPNLVMFSWLGGTLVELIRKNQSLLFWQSPELAAPAIFGITITITSLVLKKYSSKNKPLESK